MHFPARAGWLLQRKTWEKELAEKWPVGLSLLTAIGKQIDEKMRMLKLHVKTSFNILLFFATVLNACGMVFSKSSQDCDNSVRLSVTYKLAFLIVTTKYINMPWLQAVDSTICCFWGCFPCWSQKGAAKKQAQSLNWDHWLRDPAQHKGHRNLLTSRIDQADVKESEPSDRCQDVYANRGNAGCSKKYASDESM